MTNHNATAINNFMQQVWERADPAALDRFVIPDFIDHAYTPHDVTGHASMVRNFSAAFSNARHTIEQSTAQDDHVLVRIRVTAQHTGTFRDIAATGKHIEVAQYRSFRFVDGMIAEHWALFDTPALLRQIQA